MHLGRNIRISTLSLFASMALAACTTSGEVTIDPAALKTPIPLVEQAPITIGVHYEELRNHYYLQKWAAGRPVKFEYRLGPPSIALFDRHFSSMFETVVRVDSPSTMIVLGQNVSAVLSVKIKSMHPESDIPSIEYAVTLYVPPGNKLATIEAFADSGFEAWVGRSNRLARAMRKAVATMVVSFYDDPIIKAWLKNYGVGENVGAP